MHAVRPSLTPLAAVALGASARIAEIRGGRGLTHKLLGLGLRVGSDVRVLQHRGRGLVLSSAETRVAIGGGIADQLWVELLTPESFGGSSLGGPDATGAGH
jgi:ferrous iron transport protein A